MKKIPTAIGSSAFTIFGVTVKCHVLDDGQRIVDADDVAAMFRAMEQPSLSGDLSRVALDDELKGFARWMSGE